MRLTRSVNRDDILPFQKGELEGKKRQENREVGEIFLTYLFEIITLRQLLKLQILPFMRAESE